MIPRGAYFAPDAEPHRRWAMLLELPDLLDRFDVSLELRPVRKRVKPRDLDCGAVIDFAAPAFDRALSLVLQAASAGSSGIQAPFYRFPASF